MSFSSLLGLKKGIFLAGTSTRSPVLGLRPSARLALAGTEAAKAADLDLVAGAQRAHHALEDGFDDDFAVLARQFGQPGNFIDQVCLGHLARPLSRYPSQLTSTTDTLKLLQVGKYKFRLSFPSLPIVS